MESFEPKHDVIRGCMLIAAIAAALLLFSWVVIHWDLDRSISRRFYTAAEGWYLGKKQPWISLYRFGEIPGFILAFIGLAGWLFCKVKKHYHHLNRYFLVIVLTAVIGPGLLVNGILKPTWGRPRPRQVQEFGGLQAYRHMYQPNIFENGKSFTCGHCAMGFLFLSLMVFHRKKTWLAYAGGATAFLLGGFLGATRIVQGGHFLSDVIWSLGVVSMVFIALYYILIKIPLQEP